MEGVSYFHSFYIKKIISKDEFVQVWMAFNSQYNYGFSCEFQYDAVSTPIFEKLAEMGYIPWELEGETWEPEVERRIPLDTFKYNGKGWKYICFDEQSFRDSCEQNISLVSSLLEKFEKIYDQNNKTIKDLIDLGENKKIEFKETFSLCTRSQKERR